METAAQVAADATAQGSRRLRSQELPPKMRAISRWRGSFDLAWTWALIFVVVWSTLANGSFWVVPLGLVVVGALQNRMLVLWHHAIHQNLHPARRINDALARWGLIAPMGQPFGLMHRAHMRHHLRVGQADDSDRWYYDLGLFGRRNPARFRRWLLSSCVGGLLIPQVRKVLTGKRDRDFDPGMPTGPGDGYDRFAVLVAQAVLFGTFWALGGAWWAYFVLWALPAATVGAGFNTLRTALEHADGETPPRLYHSFRSGPLERFFIAPFHMTHHWEHHLLMAVPYYHMPALRRLLVENNAYGDGQLVGSYRERLAVITTQLRSAAPPS